MYKKWAEKVPSHKDITYRFTYMIWLQKTNRHFIVNIEYNLETKKFKIESIENKYQKYYM